VQDLPLKGIRVLDLTTFLSGPYATQLLGDLGAEVVKIEPPGGDSSRAVPSHEVGGDAAYYLANNRNKASVCVDLKDPEGQEVVRRLALRSDVVVENFRPGVAARLGLDAASLTAENGRLVWVSISGFGQDGPLRDRPAYDMIVQALSGVMSLTGEPGGRAMRLGVPLGDIGAGLFATIGVLAALTARAVSGRGRVVDVAMLDSMLNLLSYQGVYALISGEVPKPQGAAHDSIPTYRSFLGSDGREFVVTANTQRMWTGTCRAIGRPELADDPRFSTAARRLEHRAELWVILERAFSAAPADHWLEVLVAEDVPAAAVRNVVEALADASEKADHVLVPLANERGEFTGLATPIRFGDTEDAPRGYPPRLGQDTETYLRKLGFAEDQIHRLLAQGTVRAATPPG
jgi:CoA:oxalate CoA-transferase